MICDRCDLCGLPVPAWGRGDGIGSCDCPCCACGQAIGSVICTCPEPDGYDEVAGGEG